MQQRNEHESHERSASPDVTVGNWTTEQYTRIAKWPALAVFLLNVIATTSGWNAALPWFFLIVVTVGLGIAAAIRYRGNLTNATALGFAAGLIVGVLTSLFQFFWFHNLEAFFRIITTSLLSILVGVLMSTSAFLIFAKEHRPSHRARHHRPTIE